MQKSALLGLVFASLLAGACTTPIGAGGQTLPSDTTNTCARQCQEIGLGLDSVVIMAANVGCVCRAGTVAPTPGNASVSGGVTSLMIAEQRRKNSSPAGPPHH
jgi:hypothetical protein